MALFSRLFPGRKNCRSNCLKWTPKDESKKKPDFDKNQIRLVLFKDQDQKKLLFDSKSVRLTADGKSCCQSSKPCQQKTVLEESGSEAEKQTSARYTVTRPASDTKMLGEMMFGSAPVAYSAATLKVHTIRSPLELLVTKVFATSRTSYRESMGESESYDSCSGQYSSADFTNPKQISGEKNDGATIAHSIPVAVPNASPQKTEDSVMEGDDSGMSLSVTSSSSSANTPFPSPGSGSSHQSNSFNSLRRRWQRSHMTSLEFNPRRSSDESGFSTSEGGCGRKRPVKIGVCIIIQLSEERAEAAQTFQNFFFSHITLLENHINKLQMAVERAFYRSKVFVPICMEALTQFQDSIFDLYTASRLKEPVWLNMMSYSTHRVALCHQFLKEFMTAVEKYDTKNTKFFVSTLVTAVLTNHLAWVPTVTPAGATPARTYLDKHSAKWLDALAKSNPYNAQWAQLGDLYGSIGFPLRQARTVVVGKKADVVNRLLYILSYFIRCSEVQEVQESRKPIDDDDDDIVLALEMYRQHSMEDSKDTFVNEMETIKEASRNNSQIDLQHYFKQSNTDRARSRFVAAASQRMFMSDLDFAGAHCSSLKEAEFTDSNSTVETESCDGVRLVSRSESEMTILSDTLTSMSDSTTSTDTVRHSCTCVSMDGEVQTSHSNKRCMCMSRSSSHSQDSLSVNGHIVAGSPVCTSQPVLDNCSARTLPVSGNDHTCNTESALEMNPDREQDIGYESEKPSIDSLQAENSRKCQLSPKEVVEESKVHRIRHVGREPIFECRTALDNNLLGQENHFTFKREEEDLENEEVKRLTGGTDLRLDSGMFDYKSLDYKHTDGTKPGYPERESCSRSTSENEGEDNMCQTTMSYPGNYQRSTSQFDEYFADAESDDNFLPSSTELKGCDTCTKVPYHRLSSADFYEEIADTPCPEVLSSPSKQNTIVKDTEFNNQRDVLEMFDEYFNKEESQTHTENHDDTCCSAQDIPGSHLERPDSLDLSSSGRRPGSLGRVRHGSGGGGVSRQNSTTPTPTPGRTRSVTPTELGRRRNASGSTSTGTTDLENFDPFLNLKEVPMPCCESTEEAGSSIDTFEKNFGRSLLGGYSNHYMSDFVLHGTSDQNYCAKLHSDLTLSVKSSVLGEPIAESVCIVADTDKWSVKLHRCRYSTADRKNVEEVVPSRFICDVVESVHNLWKLKMSPEFCIMHLEDRLQEVYFKSKVLAEYINRNRTVNMAMMKEVSAMLGYDSSDFPLLFSVAGTHTAHLSLALI